MPHRESQWRSLAITVQSCRVQSSSSSSSSIRMGTSRLNASWPSWPTHRLAPRASERASNRIVAAAAIVVVAAAAVSPNVSACRCRRVTLVHGSQLREVLLTYLASCLRAPAAATDRPAMDLAVTRSDLSMDHGPDKKCMRPAICLGRVLLTFVRPARCQQVHEATDREVYLRNS